jgi:hypothetical protein
MRVVYRVLDAPEGLHDKASHSGQARNILPKCVVSDKVCDCVAEVSSRSKPHFLHDCCCINLIRLASLKGRAIDCVSPYLASRPSNAGRNQHAQF